MKQNTENNKQDGIVRDIYIPDQDRSLTDAILNVIKNCKGNDLLRTDFVLFEDINPAALSNLFRHDAQPRTRVAFTTDGVQVELWGDGGVEIRVEDQTVE